MPLLRRIPKSGFNNTRFARRFKWINIGVLQNNFSSGAEVSPDILRKKGLIKGNGPVKILGDGEIKHPLKVAAHSFSKSASEKIKKAGGTVATATKGTKATKGTTRK